MIIPFSAPQDGAAHQYCISCFAESPAREERGGRIYYRCVACGKSEPRSLVIDPEIVWWVDKDTGDYWHESVGVVLIDRSGRVLLFERTTFPFAFAIPAGHLDVGEAPNDAALRELAEEAGVVLHDAELFTEENLEEPCRRGADHHRWHLYVGRYDGGEPVVMREEGRGATWASLEEALAMDLTSPTRHFLEKYGRKIVTQFR